MNAAFFGLALVAALNPKLLAVDLLLIENRRPRAMFLGLLAGGLGTAIAIGFLDVFVLQADAVQARAWLMSHARRLIAIALIIAGTYMAVTGLIRLI